MSESRAMAVHLGSDQPKILPNEDYAVGWICAIGTELVAARAFLEETFELESVHQNDNNSYTLGRIGRHNVVIAVLPDGEYGLVSAANVARDMVHSFPNIKIGLMVGIGGGVPTLHDIRLGDVVVSSPSKGFGGVLQYDFGKTVQNKKFEVTGFLNLPPPLLRTALSTLRARYEGDGHQLQEAINKVLRQKPRLRRKYQRPDEHTDRLYRAEFAHPSGTAEECLVSCGNDPSTLIPRDERSEDDDVPMIHYGLIASANQVMKDAKRRDELAREKDVLCFEMEAAALMNNFPCLVIRGICDYSDSHKNKAWQGYAAMAAAAYTVDLIHQIHPTQMKAERNIAELLEGVHKTTSKTAAHVEELKLNSQEDKYLKVLGWLSPLNYGHAQSDTLRRRAPGTCQWLLDSNEYRSWFQAAGQTLFCPGIPGAGKTVSTSVVIDDLSMKIGNESNIGMAYIYFNYQQKDAQTINHVLASILKQLAQDCPSLPTEVQALYNRHQSRDTRPSLSELLDVLHPVMKSYSRVFIVLDALDECSEECRSRILRELFKLQHERGINIYATSRPHIDIREEAGVYISQEIFARDEDVGRYIDDHMFKLRGFVQKNTDLQQQIKREIRRAANGMFLLAQLYFDMLQDKTSVREVKDILFGLQQATTEKSKLQALSRAYEGVMERIEGQSEGLRSLAKTVLAWVVYAKRPLKELEIQTALAVKTGDHQLDEENLRDIEDIISVCAGIVEIDETSRIVRLVHYTTQQYFDETGERWLQDAEYSITLACVTYLSFPVFETVSVLELTGRIQRDPLYEYAALNWGYHAQNAPVCTEVVTFLKREPQVRASAQVLSRHHDGFSSSRQHTTGLHLAVFFGLLKTVQELLSVYPVDLADGYGRTPLSLAAGSGHVDLVKLFLEKGADIESRNGYGQTSLTYAAEYGHGTVVQLLLDSGADTEVVDLENMTPLAYALMNQNEAIMKLLLDSGAHVENIDRHCNFALIKAIKTGTEAAVKLLLDMGVNIERTDRYGSTPLIEAVKTGNEAKVKLLLDSGADTEKKDRHGRTPLIEAVTTGSEAVLKPVFESGAVTENKDRHGNVPLTQAAKAVFDLLLEREADTRITNLNRYIPPRKEAKIGNAAIVKLLLDGGADTENTNHGRTPLMEAATNGDEAIVKLLLNSGAGTENTDPYGRTALKEATKIGREDIVKLLLDSGARTKAKRKQSRISAGHFSGRLWADGDGNRRNRRG